MILVTGAAGMTGIAVIRALSHRGIQVRALTGSGRSTEALRRAGAAEIVTGRFSDKAALLHAMFGIDTVLHIPPRMKPEEVENGCNVIGAARESGVRRIALHSVINSQIQAICFHTHKRLVEESAMTSGMPWVIFQPTNYMQNVAWSWKRMIENGEFVFPYSAEVPISWLDLEDYARAVANTLATREYDYGVYECVSTAEPLTRRQLAEIWSRAILRKVTALMMDLDAYMALPHWQGRDPREMVILRTMFEEFHRHGAPGGNSKVLEMLLGHKPTSYAEFATRYAAEQGITVTSTQWRLS